MADTVATTEVLRVEKVMREFGAAHKTRVLHDIDLRLIKGEFSALIGPSGSGKSTLLNIMGLLDRPSAGQVFISGRDTTGLNDVELTRFRGQTLGFVFQFHHLMPDFTALENALMPALAQHGHASDEVTKRAKDLLNEAGLGARMHSPAKNLSGGEAQRVAIARALCNRPDLVLADEPTGNLDTQNSDAIFALLRRFNEQMGTTFLIVTHDPRLALRCRRIVRLVDGRVVSDAANVPREVHELDELVANVGKPTG